jgi:hypothetical protein
MTFTRTRRRGAVLAIAGAALALAAGCTQPQRPDPPAPRPPASTTTTTTAPGHGDHGGGDHGTGGSHDIPDRLNYPPSAEQRAAAMRLVEENRAANAERFATTKQAVDAGYISIGDAASGVAHYEHLEHRRDGRELDVNFPEALVYNSRTGRLQTVMYILEPGKTMADVPDIAGNLTVWHGHDELCWKSDDPSSPDYLLLSGVAIGGRCIGGGTLRVEPPMLHVWIVDNPCGPFAGTDFGNRTGSCTSH